MCGAVAGGPAIFGVDTTKEAVIEGVVTLAGQPVSPAYVRLLDASGEFTAEVPTSASGEFRFFAAPGAWTVRVLAPGASADRAVHATVGEVAQVAVAL
jgi:Protein of unknown function (DUF1416)